MKKYILSGLLLLGILVVAQLISMPKASAAFGTSSNVGYFTGRTNSGSGDFVLPGGTNTNMSIPTSVNTVGELESYLEGLLSSGSRDTACANMGYSTDTCVAWQKEGAAFIIQTMRGSTACGGSWCKDETPDAAAIQDWEDRLGSLINSGGHISWNVTSPCYTTNTMDIKDHSGSDSNPNDSAPYGLGSCETEGHSIIFYNASGSVVYAIKYRCANPIGNYSGLPNPHKPTGSITGASCTTVTYTAKDTNYTTENIDIKITLTQGSNSATYTATTHGTGLTYSTPNWVRNMTTNNDVAVKLYVRDTKAASPDNSYQAVDTATINEPCANGAPSGTLTLACSGTTLTANATFSDPDGATNGYLTWGASTSTTKTSPAQWTGIPAGSTVSLHVKNVPATTYVVVKTVTGPSSCSSGPNCAGQNTAPTVTVPEAPLPSHPGSTVSTSGPGGATTSNPSATWYQETSYQYQMNDAYDQWGGQATHISSTPAFNAAFQNSNQFTLHYDNYVSQYPYDLHVTTIKYTEKWKEQKYVADTSRPQCAGGYTLVSGPRCRTGQLDSPTYSCPSGQYVSGTSCYNSSTNAYVGPATVTHHYYCANGTAPSGGYCYGTVYYPYKTSGGVTNPTTQNTVAGLPYGANNLDQCLYRQFQVEDGPPNAAAGSHVGNIQVNPSPEDPRQVIYQAVGLVDFSRDPSESASLGVHDPNKVQIGWTAQYYYSSDPTAGPSAGTPMPNCPNASGNLNYSSGSFNAGNSQTTNSTTCNANPTFAPPMQAGDLFCADYQFRPSGSQIDRTGTIEPTSSGNGNYVEVYACQDPITDEPYLHVLGADVSAGGNFETGTNNCSGAPVNNAGISAFAHYGTPLSRGADTQFAALSEGGINAFASATYRSSTPTSPDGLSFADTPSDGNFGAQPCIHDYYASMPGGTVSSPFSPSGQQAYSYSSTQSIGNVQIADSSRLTVYINGDLRITGNITNQNTAWSSIDQVPSFVVIVKGNIYIDSSVTQLDGIYIAQPVSGGGKGTIYTCSDASTGAVYPASSMYTTCDSQLVINGALVAKTVKFYRTYGSLRNSVSNEYPNGGSGVCAQQNGDPTISGARTDTSYDCAAEIINFTPEIYLTNPYIIPSSGPATGKYDYITSLSPVL